MFDLEQEHLGVSPIWVRLSGLPLQLWTEDVFHLIGDDLGQYLDFDRSFLDIRRMYFTHILVYWDTREGLVENWILHYIGLVHNQILDYEDIPFKCHGGH